MEYMQLKAHPMGMDLIILCLYDEPLLLRIETLAGPEKFEVKCSLLKASPVEGLM